MRNQLRNKPHLNDTVTKSEHSQQQRNVTMKKVMYSFMISATIATSSIAVPAHAAVIHTVKSIVSNVKNDTSIIRSQTGGIKTRVEEVSSSVNANIAESIDIRSLVEPLELVHKMKDRFASAGIDPAELLDIVDTSEIRDKIDEIKEEKQIIEDAMNGPNVEIFREDLVAMLNGLDGLIFENIPTKPSPLQTLIEKAPQKLIASIMLGVGDKIIEIKDLVVDIQSFYKENEQYFSAASTAAEKGMTVYAINKGKGLHLRRSGAKKPVVSNLGYRKKVPFASCASRLC